MKRRNHNNRQVELPNFCHLGVNLRIALTAEAALVAGVVARVADAQAFWAEFIGLSALAQPALLLTLLALCAAGRWLRSQPYRLGVAFTLALGVAVPMLVTLWLSPVLAGGEAYPPHRRGAIFPVAWCRPAGLFQFARPRAVARDHRGAPAGLAGAYPPAIPVQQPECRSVAGAQRPAPRRACAGEYGRPVPCADGQRQPAGAAGRRSRAHPRLFGTRAAAPGRSPAGRLAYQ